MNARKQSEKGGMTAVVLICCAAGAVTVATTLSFSGTRGPAGSSAPPQPIQATEEYGRRLITQTSELLGPDVADPAMRMSGSRLQCASCHLAAGAEPGTLTLLQAADHYPRFSGRVGAKTDIEDRVNECMQRSMNGKPLDRKSPEMIAMASYIRSLGALNQALGAGQRKANEPAGFKTPDRAASPEAGKKVFGERCAACHGMDGLGLRASADPKRGYVFPPLWGPDSFNDGAGMHRVLTAAKFIKARMPLGNPDLTSDQAFDVAAYINSQPRPEMANLEKDYPDRSAKPVDNAYGPFADDFPQKQHQYGPFGPIEAYYKQRKAK
jgi:thiosulfate dehydrogenase